MADDDTEAAIDQLHELPLAEFVDARNALAGRLKAKGDRAAAERVKALVKPTAAAWAVNQVYRRARAEFDGLMDAARRLRIRQQAAGPSSSASELREVMRERRDALSRALEKAATILTGAGHTATPATLQKVAATLEALAAQPEESSDRPGRLTHELEPPGFEALGITAPAPPSTSPLSPGPPRPEAAQAQATFARAEAEVAARRRAQETAAAAAAESKRRAEAAQAAFDEAERRLAEANQRTRDSEDAVRRAAAALADAERALAEARATRKR